MAFQFTLTIFPQQKIEITSRAWILYSRSMHNLILRFVTIYLFARMADISGEWCTIVIPSMCRQEERLSPLNYSSGCLCVYCMSWMERGDTLMQCYGELDWEPVKPGKCIFFVVRNVSALLLLLTKRGLMQNILRIWIYLQHCGNYYHTYLPFSIIKCTIYIYNIIPIAL